ncbi:MAG TPA: 4-hydroxybenzoate octaprenyltransferase, partial [Ramlibacter sp.]|nr:4-hydroxybenzoate octaprenyltransferase [Ramlibacter sp.]
VMFCYGAAIAIWALALVGRIPLLVILVTAAAAAAQALWHYTLIRDRSRDGCFKAFRLNHWLGFTLFAGTVLGYALNP